ncbi:MAG: hypothetical protein EA419_08525 [Wenzhouxiangella sp.]|nr:MAG: hypothetical protein EA419_08525 [Wenzhouxiangella sp.]
MKNDVGAIWTRWVLALAYLGLIVFWVFLLREASGPLLPAVFFLILAIPAGLFGTYLATLRRIHWLSAWSTDSFAVRWLSGPWLRLLTGFLMAFVASALLSFRFSVADGVDLTLLAMCVLLLGLVLSLFGNWLRKQFQPLYREGRALFWAAVICAAVMSLVDPAARFAAGAYVNYATVGEAIEAVRGQGNWLGDSAVAHWVSDWGSSWGGLERFVLGQLAENPGFGTLLAVMVSVLTRFPLYFMLGLSVCAFVLPFSEYRRVLLPSSSSDEPGRLSSSRIAWASASATILVLFIYLPVIGMIESKIESQHATRSPEAVVVRTVELIGDQYHAVGTMDEVGRLAESMVYERGDVLRPIDQALGQGFSIMRANVDTYLDWYYSLPGEWTRLAQLLTGNIEDHLRAKLTEQLGAGEPFASFEQEFEQALRGQTESVDEFRRLADELLDARRVEVAAGEEVHVVARGDREDLLSLPIHSGITSLEQRLGVTAATAGISGVVAAAATRQVIVRLATRGTLRTAATAIARLTLIRTGSSGGGAAGGAVLGGAIGSVLPGLGTAIGAAVGGAIGGLAIGVGAEYLILKLEEWYSRDRHRQELIASIDEAEAGLRQQFGLERTSER